MMLTTRARLWILCGLLSAATALSYLDRQVLSVLAPKIIADFSMSNEAYSRVLFAFVLSYTIMGALGGKLMDKLGTRRGFAVAVGFWSLASAAHAWVTGVVGLTVARFALGLGEGPAFPAATKGAIDWFPVKDRGVAVALATGGSAFGAVIAPPLTAWSTRKMGWRGTFLAVAAVGLLWLIFWALATRGLSSRPSPAAPSRKVSARDLLRRPELNRILISRFIFDPVFYFYMFWIPQFLSKERGLSLNQIGALTWIPFFVLGIAQISAGWASDRIISCGTERRRARLTLMLAGALVTPVSCLILRSGSAASAIALMSVFLLAHGFWITNYMILIAETVGNHEVGTAIGISATIGGISGMLTSLAIGWTVDHFSFAPVFVAVGIVYPLAWLFIVVGKWNSRFTPYAPSPEAAASPP